MTQEYHKYTAEDHEVWSLLFTRQMQNLPPIAAKAYLDGMAKCGFVSDRVPNFNDINKVLAKATGWEIVVVPGLIDNKPFFENLSASKFPSSTWLRSKQQLDYLEEPDMFHDTFGHIPLLCEDFFCRFLAGLSDIILDHIDNPIAVEMMARLYWYTVEFGLIKEGDQTKIYGAGILSSAGESIYSLSDTPEHLAYDPQMIMDTPYIKDKYQTQYFVIDNYEQLFKSLPEIRSIIERSANMPLKAAS